MTLRSLFGTVVISAFLLASAAKAQDEGDRGGALGTAEDVDPNESPVIIEQRPPPRGEAGGNLRSSRDALVQIRGAWATEEAVCASGEGEATGLYLTDTLIRWEGATCSIYNIDSRNGSATIYSRCVGQNGRRERQFQVEMQGDDTLTLRPEWPGAREEFKLMQCPGNQ